MFKVFHDGEDEASIQFWFDVSAFICRRVSWWIGTSVVHLSIRLELIRESAHILMQSWCQIVTMDRDLRRNRMSIGAEQELIGSGTPKADSIQSQIP